MKVTEVIQHSYHKIKSDASQFQKNMGVKDLYTFYGPKHAPNPTPKNKLVKVLGHGAYASAVEVKDSGKVLKISRGTHDLNEDPYYQFMSRLAAHPKMESNPFIPKIYQVKVYETQNKAHPYFYIVKMEKLQNIRDLSDKELIEMILALTKAKMTASFKIALGMTTAPEILKQQSHGKLIEILTDKIHRGKIKNPQLQAALDFAASTGMQMDITSHNLMVRRTPEGPQLVLADPVAN